jgi:hypothetical protein
MMHSAANSIKPIRRVDIGGRQLFLSLQKDRTAFRKLYILLRLML